MEQADLDLLGKTLACIKQNSSNEQFVKVQRSTGDGISLPIYIRSMQQSQKNDKMCYTYQLVVYDLSGNINIPPHVGERVNETTIKLKVEGKVKMTDAERDEHRKNNPRDTLRQYNSVYEKDIELCVGMDIRHAKFNTCHVKPTGMPFKAGSFVIARGLHVTEKIGGSFGIEWNVSSFAELPGAPPSAMKMMKHLAAHNYLLNVSRSNPEHGEHNETEADKKLREKLSTDPKQGKFRSAQDALLLANLPSNVRSRTDQLIVMPLRGHLLDAEDAPKLFANDISAFFQCPIWEESFTRKEQDDTLIKAVNVQSTVVLTERSRNSMQLVCVQIKFYDKQASLLNVFGIVNVPLFGALAPILVPACEGYVAAGMAIQDSNKLCEQLLLDESNTNFGVSAWARFMYVDLVSGIVRCGFPIDYRCAHSAVEAAMNGVTNFADNPSSDFADINPLNKVSGKLPVINLREAMINMSDIKQDYTFFLVTTKSADDASEKCDDYSAIITGATTGFPGALTSLKNNYTVFAIRSEHVEAERNRINNPLANALEDETFVESYKSERKRKAETELSREQLIVQEIAALDEAGFLD